MNKFGKKDAEDPLSKIGFLKQIDKNKLAAQGVKISIKNQLMQKGLVFNKAQSEEQPEDSASQDSGLEFVASRDKGKSKDEEEKPKVMQVSGRTVHQERVGVSLATRTDFFKSLKDKKMSKF